MNTLLSSLLHLFYPHSCEGCGTDLLHTETVLCLHCQGRLPVTGFHLFTDNPVTKIFRGRADIRYAMAAYYYTRSSVLQQLIHQFKYHRRKDIALHLGRQTGHLLQQSKWLYEINCIVPVPMHALKEKRRGYNQAAELAAGIAAIVGKPVIRHALAREHPSVSQTQQNRLLRWQNVSREFCLKDAAALRYQHVLLIDDVITTGATVEACSRVLEAASATISVCSLAYANR